LHPPHSEASSVLAQLAIDGVLLGLAPLAGLTLRIRITMGVEEVLQLGGDQLLLEHVLVLRMGDLHDALAVKVRLTVAQVLFDAGRDQQDVAVAGEGDILIVLIMTAILTGLLQILDESQYGLLQQGWMFRGRHIDGGLWYLGVDDHREFLLHLLHPPLALLLAQQRVHADKGVHLVRLLVDLQVAL